MDLTCKLRTGFTKALFTQEDLKKLIGREIESYRIFKGIKSPKEEKHRCWRLDYQDDLSFHMDIVPCIPEEKLRQNQILESVKSSGINEALAGLIAKNSVSITDDRHPRYRQISDDWLLSNPQGYEQEFESIMKQGLWEKRHLVCSLYRD